MARLNVNVSYLFQKFLTVAILESALVDHEDSQLKKLFSAACTVHAAVAISVCNANECVDD